MTMMPESSNSDPLGYLDELRLTLDEADTQAMLQELGLLSPLLRGTLDCESSELRRHFHDQTGLDQIKAVFGSDGFTNSRAGSPRLEAWGGKPASF